MPASPTVGYMQNNLVITLCGAYISLIYQAPLVCIVRLFTKRPLQ